MNGLICHHGFRLAIIAGLVWWLAGCAAKSPAWVEDRGLHAASKRSQVSKTSKNRRIARRPAHYTVRKGDTLYSIAFRYGLRFQDLARWNGIGKPYVIHPGQKLRLYPLPRQRQASRPLRAQKPASGNKATQTGKRPPTGYREPAVKPAKPVKSGTARPVKGWHWPVRGRLLSTFKASDPARQGINIAVEAGTPVRAAAAGKVVYSGNGLRGYGELVIIKHNDQWLTAYGHNRKRKVKEGQQVKAGQVIAEAGNSEAPRSMLHFEIRKNGKPVNPLKYLP